MHLYLTAATVAISLLGRCDAMADETNPAGKRFLEVCSSAWLR